MSYVRYEFTAGDWALNRIGVKQKAEEPDDRLNMVKYGGAYK